MVLNVNIYHAVSRLKNMVALPYAKANSAAICKEISLPSFSQKSDVSHHPNIDLNYATRTTYLAIRLGFYKTEGASFVQKT